MIDDWFDMRDETIYRWFTEMKENPLADAIFDETRAGRPAELTTNQREEFKKALHEPPKEADLDAPARMPKLPRKYLRGEFDVEYMLRHIRRIMHEAGISWQTPRPQP